MNFVLERVYREGTSNPEKFILTKRGRSYTCGRGKENHIICLSMVVSRKHCIFFHSNDGLYVSDLQSSNGIYINGSLQRSLQMIRLCENDLVGIGCADLTIGNNDNSLYVYKVNIIKPLDEEAENSILAKTLLNNDVLKRPSSSEDSSRQRCSSSSMDCDMPVPCKMPKYEDNSDNCRVNHTRGTNPADENNRGSHSSKNNNNNVMNSTEVKSVDMDVDDDIEIIHTSLVNRTKAGFNEGRNNPIGNVNSNYKPNSATYQCCPEVPKNCKEEIMDFDVNDNENNDSDGNVNKINITEKASSSVNNDVNLAKSPDIICINDQMIKLEDELQITDEEGAHAEPSTSKTIPDGTPFKLRKVKQEARTRFSEIDVVDLSDDEDSVFPYSQLFDIGYENDAEKRIEIKQECTDEQNNEKIGLLSVDDEVIILTDDEDEDNPWLERLSRSQLLNEDNKPEIENKPVVVKDEIDLEIWNNEISSILQSDELYALKEIDTKQTSVASPASEKDDARCKDTKSADSPAANIMEPMDVSNIDPSKKLSLGKTDSASQQKTDAKHMELGNQKKPDNLTIEPRNAVKESDNIKETENLTKEPEPLLKEVKHVNDLIKESDITKELDNNLIEEHYVSIENAKPKSVTRCFVTTSKRLIPVIEPLSLPVRRRNTSRVNDSKEKQKRTEEKPQSKKSSPTKKKALQTLKDQLNESFYGKRKRRKDAQKSAADAPSTSEVKPGTSFISKEEKKMIIEKRKAKLKEIAEEKKKLAAENNKVVKRVIAKPRAKVSLKNRGDFLISEGKVATSKPLPDKSAENLPSKSSDNQSEKRSTKKAETLEKRAASDTNAQELHQQKNYSNKTVSNIAASLEQSLHLDNTASTIEVTKENNNKQEHKTNREKRSSSSRGKKKHETASDCGAKTPESRSKSTERASILVQKENFSPNRKSADKSKLVRDRTKTRESSKQKKTVRFSDNVDIQYYEVEAKNHMKKLVGKDAPIPTNKLARTPPTTSVHWQRPKLEEFLSRIFLWNPVWLEEQRYLKCLPPIVSDRELQPMKQCYGSYQEYYMVAMPLLLLEIWGTMSKDFDDVEKNMQRTTAVCSIVENSITHTPVPSTNLFLTTLTIEVLVEKEDFKKQTHPIFGDLVSFQYAKNGSGRQSFHRVFAYVVNMHETVITDFTHYNKDLIPYVQRPYAVIRYTLLMRLLEHDIAVNRVHRVRTVTYLRASIRMVQALQYLPQSPLLNLILNPRIADYQLPPMCDTLTASKITENNLNPKQLEAVYRVSETVLRKEAKLCFIQGPPGTGKSKVIVNLVPRILYGGQQEKAFKILVCAPSNAATDEIVLRLLAVRSALKGRRFKMVRIGRPESMHPTAKSISVTELAKRYIMYTASQTNESDMRELEARINSFENTFASSYRINEMKKIEMEKISMKCKIRQLMDGKTWEGLESKFRAKILRMVEDMILKGADVITCTLSSCYTNQMESVFGSYGNRISVCIVDEATQSCEAETLIPLMLGVNTLVLVGDPNQLPATILSQQAKKLGLDQSVFSRVQSVFAPQPHTPIIMLDTQYRMDYAISYWPNKYFYGGKLKNSAQTRMRFPFYSYRVLNHNSVQNNDKFSNTTEAEFVANIIFSMLAFAKWDNLGENASISIGVLTPYTMQRALVQSKITEKISPLPESLKKKINFEVNTVDGFQGQERDVIIMSCVRSHGIGFLSDRQRLCVALTRAKHSLILCGNFNTFMRDQMWNALLADARSRGILCNIDAHATPTNIKQCIVK
ncbi:probable helicase senataxin isoform X2 [Ooceraea biroi]|uniref:probable helicase senataxin isoform X2 n=1 Tax=Ooceraea biroi TaxID=2015173 RepID=UPI0005B7EFDE|nr:probable helicase senataxin isoform X2 [Ooceraea biroi]